MKSYNFDEIIDRRHTDATKIEEMAGKFGRSDLLPLWIADMDFATPEAVTRALVNCVSQRILGYNTPPPEFYECISRWLNRRHGWKVAPEAIDYVPGVKKGIGLAVNHFTEPGDAIVLQPPVYHSFRSVIEGYGRRVVNNPLVLRDGEYTMDLAGLREVMRRERPKMMVVCNPQNPIGIQWPADMLKEVADICAEHGVIILSDEIYADLVMPGVHHVPTASVSPVAEAITVTLGAPSKAFNIPGIASAWTTAGDGLRDGWFNYLRVSEFDTPPVAAIYSMMAAYNECEDWLDAMMAYLDENACLAMDYIKDNMPGIEVWRPQAGFGLWMDFRPLGITQEEITDMLVNKARVAVSDGAAFGAEGCGCVRLNFGTPRPVLLEALGRIAGAVKSRRP